MFASRIDTPLLADPAGVTYAPVLHVRWQNDGSGLTPFPQDRPATPASFPPSGNTDFTLNDDGLDPSGREFSVSVRNLNSASGDGPLFRSGRLTALGYGWWIRPAGDAESIDRVLVGHGLAARGVDRDALALGPQLM